MPPSKIVTLSILFPLRLQPQFYKPADGVGAAGLVVLASGPILDLIRDGRRQTYSHGRIAPGRRPAALFFGATLIDFAIKWVYHKSKPRGSC